MTHFGILCHAKTGHLNTMLPLGSELQRRGHRVTFPLPAFSQVQQLVWLGQEQDSRYPLARLSVSRLRVAIQEVLSQDSYKNSTSSLQEAIQRAGGVKRVADIVELATSQEKPLLATV